MAEEDTRRRIQFCIFVTDQIKRTLSVVVYKRKGQIVFFRAEKALENSLLEHERADSHTKFILNMQRAVLTAAKSKYHNRGHIMAMKRGISQFFVQE